MAGTFSAGNAMQNSSVTETGDEELYRRTRKGDQRAFTVLYERHEPPLYRYALHMTGSRVVAEEIVHEMFARLIGGELKYDERRGGLEAYLYGTVRNLARMKRRESASVAEIGERAFEHDIADDLIRNESIAALHAALRELPERYRDAIALCDLEEKSYEDAARVIACPVGTVRSRLHRARAMLAATLKRADAARKVGVG